MLKIECEPQKLGEEFVRHLVESRFRQKKNTFIAIVGGPGEGKSYTALRLAEIIQPDFDVKTQVVYYPHQFLDIINNASKRGIKVLVLDEAQVTIPAKLWYSFTNLAISFVTTTFRQLKSLALIIVTPNINWVEKTIREIINFYGVVARKENTPVYLKLYSVGFNYYDLKDQHPYLQKIRFIWNGKVYTLKQLKVGMPSEKIINEYEEMSREFKKKLIETQLEDVLTKIEKKVKIENKNLEEIANKLLGNEKLLTDFVRKTKRGFKLKKIDVKNLFNLTDTETNKLEKILIEKMKELGWI